MYQAILEEEYWYSNKWLRFSVFLATSYVFCATLLAVIYAWNGFCCCVARFTKRSFAQRTNTSTHVGIQERRLPLWYWSWEQLCHLPFKSEYISTDNEWCCQTLQKACTAVCRPQDRSTSAAISERLYISDRLAVGKPRDRLALQIAIFVLRHALLDSQELLM